MGARLHGLNEALASFAKINRSVVTETRAAVRESAADVRDLARKYAPVDKHDLERAIKAGPSKETRDGYGWRVYVERAVGDVEVGKYAWIIHDMRGVRWNNLGPKSKAKAASLGVRVGEKFLARAIRDLKKQITERVAAAVRKGISQGAIRGRGRRRS